MAAASPDLGTGPTNQQGPSPQTGSTTPTGQVIGPLPASTMPGVLAQVIPTMANFQFLLGVVNNLQTEINNITPGGNKGTVTEIDTSLPIIGGPITAQGTIGHATSGVSAGQYGDASHVSQITVDQWGHVTQAANIPFSSGSSVSITATSPIVVTPTPITGTGVVSHAASGVTAATYGDTANYPIFTVEADGHITSASNQAFGPYEPIFSFYRLRWWMATNGGLTGSTTGFQGFQTAGTQSSPVQSSTNYYSQQTRVTQVCPTSHTSFSSWRMVAQVVWRGNATGLGGFTSVSGQGMHLVITSQRVMWGWCGTGGNVLVLTAGVQPSSLTDCIFMGVDSGDTTWQIMSNDSSGTCTKIDTGFSSTTTDTDWYRLTFSCAPDDSQISYLVEQQNTGSTFSGSITSNLPTNTTFMNFRWESTNNANAGGGIISTDTGYVYTQTLY